MGIQWQNDLDMASLIIPSQQRHGRSSCWPASWAMTKRRSRKRISRRGAIPTASICNGNWMVSHELKFIMGKQQVIASQNIQIFRHMFKFLSVLEIEENY
jgi:hypothetical protein